MGFINETIKLLGIDNSIKNQTFCYVSPKNGVIVEGYKKIYELSNTKITVFCEDGKKLEILGNNLSIKELSYKELSINGTINTINFE